MHKVIVVTRTDLGWDCVVAVYIASDTLTLEDVKTRYSYDDCYVVAEHTLETELEEE